MQFVQTAIKLFPNLPLFCHLFHVFPPSRRRSSHTSFREPRPVPVRGPRPGAIKQFPVPSFGCTLHGQIPPFNMYIVHTTSLRQRVGHKKRHVLHVLRLYLNFDSIVRRHNPYAEKPVLRELEHICMVSTSKGIPMVPGPGHQTFMKTL